MKFAAYRFDDLPPSVLKRLYGLTNSAERGDVRDTGSGAGGSLFRNQLDARLMGESFPNTHVILAKHHFRYAGWCMVTRHDLDPETGKKQSVPSGQVGFYVHPDFRRARPRPEPAPGGTGGRTKNRRRPAVGHPWSSSSHSHFLSCGFEEVSHYVTGYQHGIAAMDIPPASVKARVG